MTADLNRDASSPREMASPIVVGVSRRSASIDAVRWAAAEAQLRRTTVLALTAWRGPTLSPTAGAKPPAVQPVPSDDLFAAEQERLAALLRGSLGDLESLNVTFEVRHGSATTVLLAAAVGAQLLVLDSPRSKGLSTVGKSLIAPQLVFQSPCPVVLMPHSERDTEGAARQASATLTAVPDPS